jgi:acyl-CoA dehydrogenase
MRQAARSIPISSRQAASSTHIGPRMAAHNSLYRPRARRINMRSMYLFEQDEHAELRRNAKRFAETQIRPNAATWEEAEEFPRALYTQAAEVGLLGIGYAEAIGGTGGNISHALVASEELVQAGHSVGTVVGLGSHSIALPPIVKFGTTAQCTQFVGPVLRGQKIAALAITEPGGGAML